MKPDENLENLIRESGMETRAEWLEQTKTEMLNTFQQTAESKAAAESIWRQIMRNRMTKTAAAAVLIVAAWIGINIGTTSGVAWAEVIRPVLEAVNVEYDAVVDETGDDPQRIHDVVVGPRIRRSFANGPVKEAIIDTQSQTLFVLVPSEKTAVTIHLKNLPEKLNPMSRMQYFIQEIENESGFEVQQADTDTVDGQSAVGFLASHPQKKLMIWADPTTALPIRIDVKDGQAKEVICRNFQFDGQIPQSLMEMEVPQGYVHEEHTLDLAGLPEADLIEGLRFYAQFNDGMFPEDISVLHCMQPGEDIHRRIETLSQHDQDALRVLLQTVRQLLLLQYYNGPGQWHWIGTGVELGDAAIPIYWYQPMDSSTYRVIYGDLHVEDVTESELPEPVFTDHQIRISEAAKQQRKQVFIGNEEDRWHLGVSNFVTAHSLLTLRGGTMDTNRMYIDLPYSSGVLEAVTCDDSPIAFSEVASGRYELMLPEAAPSGQRLPIECVWTVSLDALQKEDISGYVAKCQGLIPIVNFSLTFVLEPDCGFEHTQNPMQREIAGCNVSSSGRVRTDIGYCGMPIRATD